MNLVVFDLRSVVDFDYLSLRECLKKSICNTLGQEVNFNGINWNNNCSGALLDVYMKVLKRFPTEKEYADTKTAFLSCLKEYFKSTEHSFDSWEGIQHLFASIEKKRGWDFMLVSDYWLEGTNFVLSACGVYTKNLKIYTADDALSAADLVNRACYNLKLNSKKDELHLVGNYIKKADLLLKKRQIRRVLSTKDASKHFTTYPKFSKLFNVV